MRAFDLVTRIFERHALVDLFLYLFDVMWNPRRDSQNVRQGFIDLIPSSSENIFTSILIDDFANKFVLITPQNLVALRKIDAVNNFGELVALFFRFSWSFDQFKRPLKFYGRPHD